LNWIFFIVNVVQAVILISGTSTRRSKKNQERIATFIKILAIVIIVIDILFIFCIGEYEKKAKPDSIDQKFKKAWPWLYDNLDIIGFRSNDINDKGDFTRKFITYVSYFLLSIYLENHFIKQQKVSEGEENFTNEQYKKLFEWKDDSKAEAMIKNMLKGGKIALKTMDSVDAGVVVDKIEDKEEREAE